MQLSHYLRIFSYEEKPGYLLFYSTKRASTVLLKESILNSIDNGSLPSSDKDTLSHLGFLVTDIAEEKNGMFHLMDKINTNNTHFNAIVVLNLDCNLSCRYCYEGTMKGKHYMSQDTADLVVDFISSSITPNKKTLNIDFYGGEPLLSVELIKYISEKLKDFSMDNLDFSFTLVTNGTLLTKKTAQELATLGLTGAKITLDGHKDNHDKYRPFKSGTGSFDTIIQNIKEAFEFVKIGIGGNFNIDNFKTFPILLDYLINEGLTSDKISNIKFDPIMKTHNEQSPADFKDVGCESINEPWLIEAGFLLREEILKRGYNTHKMNPAPCMIDVQDDIVVNYDGSIYKCPALIGNKKFKVGSLSTGIKDYKKSHNLDNWKTDECINCEYLPLCFGGCRYMKYLRDGNINGIDCKKEYLDATLETFLKQDIKYRMKPQ